MFFSIIWEFRHEIPHHKAENWSVRQHGQRLLGRGRYQAERQSEGLGLTGDSAMCQSAGRSNQ